VAPSTGWDVATARRIAADGCRAVGLPAAGLTTTRMAKNAIFDVPGAGLVVRVSRHDDGPAAAAARVAHAGGVAVLAPAVTERPLRVDGHSVTFWPRCTPAGTSVDFEWLGRTLRSLTELTPELAPLVQRHLVGDAIASIRTRATVIQQGRPTGDGHEREFRSLARVLTERLDLVESSIAVTPTGPDVVVHGDAHSGNVLLTADGALVLGDLDHVGFAPPGWDQVPVDVETRRFGRATGALALLHAGYGRDCRADPGYEDLVALRELKVSTWLIDIPTLGARRELRTRLASWASGGSTAWTYL
jgi:hypothetical protein